MDLSIILLLVTSFLVIYLYYKNFINYWKKRQVPCLPTQFPFGNFKDVTMGKIGFIDQINDFYKKMRNFPYAGLYFFNRKLLLVIHPDTIKNVLNSDFMYFHDRGVYYDEENEPLSANLVALSGEKWKHVRTKVTPTFTPIKLKLMFDTLLITAYEMCAILVENQTVEVNDVALRYTTDIVASTAFGITADSISNPESEFRKTGQLAVKIKPTITRFFKRLIFQNFPELGKKLKLRILHPKVSEFFMNIVNETIDFRIKNDVKRKDFLQLLMDLLPKNNEESNDKSLTVQQIAAQCFVFFLAGVETSATTIMFALYELAKNEKVQTKARNEINDVCEENNGAITYEGISKMTFLDKVILETLRKYPPFTMIGRRCTKNYTIPNTNTILEKGTSIVIPVYALHHDENYFPEPENFNPDRFSDEDGQTRCQNEDVFLPFGEGPRFCIGKRFAKLQVKLALVTILKHFELKLNEKSKRNFVVNKSTFILSTEGGLYLDVFPLIK